MKIDMKELWNSAKGLMLAVGVSALLTGAIIGGGALCQEGTRNDALCALAGMTNPPKPALPVGKAPAHTPR